MLRCSSRRGGHSSCGGCHGARGGWRAGRCGGRGGRCSCGSCGRGRGSGCCARCGCGGRCGCGRGRRGRGRSGCSRPRCARTGGAGLRRSSGCRCGRGGGTLRIGRRRRIAAAGPVVLHHDPLERVVRQASGTVRDGFLAVALGVATAGRGLGGLGKRNGVRAKQRAENRRKGGQANSTHGSNGSRFLALHHSPQAGPARCAL